MSVTPTSSSGYQPLDPREMEPEDIGPVAAKGFEHESKVRRSILESVDHRSLPGLRARVARLFGRETDGTRVLDGPLFHLDGTDGNAKLWLDVGIVRDFSQQPPKLGTAFYLNELGGPHDVDFQASVDGQGNYVSHDTPGWQLAAMGRLERTALRVRQMIENVLSQPDGPNKGATEKELRGALEVAAGLDRKVAEHQSLARRSPEASFVASVFEDVDESGRLSKDELLALAGKVSTMQQGLGQRTGISAEERATVAEALDLVQRLVDERLQEAD